MRQIFQQIKYSPKPEIKNKINNKKNKKIKMNRVSVLLVTVKKHFDQNELGRRKFYLTPLGHGP